MRIRQRITQALVVLAVLLLSGLEPRAAHAQSGYYYFGPNNMSIMLSGKTTSRRASRRSTRRKKRRSVRSRRRYTRRAKR